MNRTALIASTAWIGFVAWWWSADIPLRPDRQFMLPQGLGFHGISPAGELMLGFPENGPVEFWSLPDCRKIREAFAATDRVNPYHHADDGRTLIARDGKVFLANLMTGQVLGEMPGLDASLRGDMTFKGDRLVWLRDHTLRICDLTSKRVLAQHLDQFSVQSVSRSFATTRTHKLKPDRTYSRDILLIDLATGEVDHRFDSLGPADFITLSPNEKFAVVTQGSMNSICEFHSASVLWTTPHLECQYQFRFENADDVVAADVMDSTDRLHVTRWRANDGIVLAPPPVRVASAALREPLGTTHFAVDHVLPPKSEARLWVDNTIESGRSWFGFPFLPLMPHNVRATLVDTRTNQSLGLLANEWIWAKELPDGRGLLAARSRDLEHGPFRIYSLPPSRDWMGLVQWGLLPPMIVTLVARLIRRRQGERRNVVACPHVGRAS